MKKKLLLDADLKEIVLKTILFSIPLLSITTGLAVLLYYFGTQTSIELFSESNLEPAYDYQNAPYQSPSMQYQNQKDENSQLDYLQNSYSKIPLKIIEIHHKKWKQNAIAFFFITLSMSIAVAFMLSISSTKRKLAENELSKGLKYEKTIATCSRHLLMQIESEASINKSLKMILETVSACRIYIFENIPDEQQGLCMKQIHEICSPGIEPQIDNPELELLPYSQGFSRWEKELSKGRIINEIVDKMPDSEKLILQEQGIQSILIIPLFTGETWCGFIGFDNTKQPAYWTKKQTKLLQTMAEMIGAYLNHNNTRNELKTLNEVLEIQNRALESSRTSAIKLMDEAKVAKAETEKLNTKLQQSIERASQMALEAQKANQSKSDFLANMSHEIRTPMNAIIGFSEILAKENLNEKQKEYINIIVDSGKNLLDLINDILDFSKIEAGRINIELLEVNLGDILYKIQNIVTNTVNEKGIEFKINQLSPLPGKITTDPVRLTQCLTNLVSNAVKFTENGHVYINVSSINKNNNRLLKIDVEDTGVGIPEDKLDIVFDSFSQADSSTTRKFGGTGLGLSITKQLLKLLNGSIDVKSVPNKGSTFSISIPIEYDVKLDLDIKRHFDRKLNKNNEENETNININGSVLVAEDNRSNQMLIKLLLQGVGIEPDFAENGKIALELVAEKKYDLILMDMQMPVINGYEATQTLREHNFEMPIVALTANAMKGDAEKCIAAGCSDYLSKPVNEKKLYTILARYLTNKKYTNPSSAPDKKETENKTQAKHNASHNEKPGTTRQTPDDKDQTGLTTSKLENDQRFTEVLQVYIDEMPGLVRNITDAYEQNNFESLKSLAHQLKGASASAGYNALSNLLEHIEQSVETTDNIQSLQQSIDQLNNICQQIIAKQTA